MFIASGVLNRSLSSFWSKRRRSLKELIGSPRNRGSINIRPLWGQTSLLPIAGDHQYSITPAHRAELCIALH